jgi:AAA lid domain
VAEAARRASGDLLMINDAHAWYRLPDRGRHLLRCLDKELTGSGRVAVILAGQQGLLRDMLVASPALAARFPAVIDFPGYTAVQLAAVFATLAGEAGFTLSPDGARKAAAVLAEADHGAGNARLAVQLLDEVTASQARRITTGPQPRDPAMLSTIDAADPGTSMRPAHPLTTGLASTCSRPTGGERDKPPTRGTISERSRSVVQPMSKARPHTNPQPAQDPFSQPPGL